MDPAPRSFGRTLPGSVARERHTSEREVSEAQGAVGYVKVLYALLAIRALLVALQVWGAFVEASELQWGDYVAVVVATTVAGVCGAALVWLGSNPFLWTLVLALLHTASLIFTLAVFGRDVLGIAFTVHTVVVAVLWWAVAKTAGVTRTLRQWAAEAKAEGKVSLARRASVRDLQDARHGARRAAMVLVSLVAASALAAWFPYQAGAARHREEVQWEAHQQAQHAAMTAQLGDVANELRAAWAQSERDAIQALFAPERRDSVWEDVVAYCVKPGQAGRLPLLSEAEITKVSTLLRSATVRFAVQGEAEALTTHWTRIDGRWFVERLAPR